MIACVDVGYAHDHALAACVCIEAWVDAEPSLERIVRSEAPPAAYEPGRFFLRELPHLIAVLDALPRRPEVVVIDGYVWLGPGRPGLGARLGEALGPDVAIVGVAKTRFHGATDAIEVRRGGSVRPLFVSALGMEPADAGRAIASMHGAHRIPEILKRVDALSRGLQPTFA